MDDRGVVVAGVLAAVIVAAVTVVALAAPAGTDVTPIITAIVGVPVAVFTGLNFVQARTNAKALNGQMDRHLENVKEVGVEAAHQTASALGPEVRKAIREGTRDAVNEILKTARGRPAGARRQGDS